MADGSWRSRVTSLHNTEGRASSDGASLSCNHSSSVGASATVFSLALLQEKYAESLAFVSPAEFRCWWVASVVLHAGCAGFLIQAGRLYLYLPTQPVMWFFELYAVAIETSNFKGIAIAYFCAAGLHFLMLVKMLTHSVRQRRIAFRGTRTSSAPAIPQAPSAPDVGTIQAPASQGGIGCRRASKACNAFWKLLSRYLTPLLRVVLAVHEAFDIRSKYYGVTWVAVEVAQTLLQTYQVFRLSALMPRLWMTNVVVVLIVLNCWAVPIVARFFCADATHARLHILALSLSLDLVSYILVPAFVFQPYQAQYNAAVGDFGDVYWYDDVWLVRMINELQLLFIVSLLDGASKAMMALSVPRSLYVLTKLLRERPAKVSASSVRLLARMSRRRATIVPDSEREGARQLRRRPTLSPASEVRAGGPVDSAANAVRRPSKTRSLLRRPSSLQRPIAALNSTQIEKWGHRFLQFWGTAVLAAHLHATTKANPSDCSLHSYPWFVSQPACSLLELDCRAEDALRDSGGSAEAIDAIIQGVDTARVQHVVIRNCPKLELPPSLSRLPQLVGLKIRDSTVVSWDETAALTHARHPELRFLFLGDVNMSSLPQGMTARDFPQRLRDIEMCRVNLTQLPDELADIWPHDMFLLLEQFQFAEFPTVVLKLRANLLSLAFNNFTEVPRALLAMPFTETLILNGNPLATLPSSSEPGGSGGNGDSDDVFPSNKMLELHLAMTDVEALPSKWSQPDEFLSRALVNVPHTPLCTNLLASEDPKSAAEKFSGAATGSGIDCFDDSRLTWYPINSP